MVDTEMPIHRGLEPFKGAARLLEVGVFLDFPLDKIANPRSCSTQSLMLPILVQVLCLFYCNAIETVRLGHIRECTTDWARYGLIVETAKELLARKEI